MKRMITIAFAAATLLVGGIAVAHDAKDGKDAKASCPMHEKADAKSAKAEGDCCRKDAAKTAAAETAKPEAQKPEAAEASKNAEAGSHCDMSAKKGEHAEHAADAAHEGHAALDAHQAKDAKHGECDMKATAGKEGKACCEKHKNAEAPATVPAT